MTLMQLLTMGYTLISLVGVVLGVLLLRRVNRARRERKRRGLNGIVSLLILKRAVRYSLLAIAMLLLMATGLDVLFTEAPRPEAAVFLLLLPLVLGGYLVFDYLSEQKVDEMMGDGGHK